MNGSYTFTNCYTKVNELNISEYVYVFAYIKKNLMTFFKWKIFCATANENNEYCKLSRFILYASIFIETLTDH